MNIKDLTPAQQAVLRVLYDRASCVRSIIIQDLIDQVPNGTVSSCLNRLKAMGLIERPETMGGEWMIVRKGATLFAADPKLLPSESAAVRAMLAEPEPIIAPKPAIRKPDESAPEPEPTPEPTIRESEAVAPEPEPDLRIAEALWEFKSRMNGGWALPAETVRVYREVVACLPPPLQEALEPLTDRLS